MDFLGLKNLTIIKKVTDQVKEVDFKNIPLDDKETYELFKNANTNGVFQFESGGMKKFLSELKPDNINDLIAAVALYRPGPMDNIPHYIARKHKKEKIDYVNNDLKNILEDT